MSPRAAILALLVLGSLAVPVAAARPDPVDCAGALVDPDLRPMAWGNATAARVWATNATVAELNATNATLARALAPVNATLDERPIVNATLEILVTPTGVAPPSAITAFLVESTLATAVGNSAGLVPCLDESLGVSESAGEITTEAGHVMATLAEFLAPVPQRVVAAEHDAECAAWQKLGQDVCGEGSA